MQQNTALGSGEGASGGGGHSGDGNQRDARGQEMVGRVIKAILQNPDQLLSCCWEKMP